MNINYEAGGDNPRESFFEWKRHTNYVTTHCPTPFLAGYNAAKTEYAAEIDNLKKALQKCEEECDSLYRGCSCEK